MCLLISLSAIVTETASFKAFLYGSAPQCQYDNWISHISEGIATANYNLYAPYDRQTNGFGTYKIATANDLTIWESIVVAFQAGDLETAQTLINNNAIPYTVVIFNDTDTNRQYYMLRENLNNTYTDNNGTPDNPDDDEIGSFSYGWGLYVMWNDAPNPIILNEVHPNDDFITIPIAHKAFVDWQAKFLIIAGAGREVKWNTTASNTYYNSISLSDASRVNAHPFSSAYKKFCDNIRAQFNRRELSVQIHSYDWNRHEGYANLQVSVGNPKTNPNLPTRDLSNQRLDFVNATDYIVFPQNTLGIHSQVNVNDYYAVNYQTNPFFYDNDGELIPVNNHIDLPGFAQNIQQNYSLSGTTDWDVFDPFFHIELDELPNCYPQNENNYFWFYGYNALTGTFEKDHYFDQTLNYYSKWIDAMTAVLPATFALNDQQTPTVPQNLHKISGAQNYIRLAWNPINSFDFKSYEILYATEPIADSNYAVFSRVNDGQLASPTCNQINVTGLTTATNYYFKIRAVDYNNNVSDLSPEISAFTGTAVIDNITCLGNDNQIVLKWRVVSQINNQGFKIYRSSDQQNYSMIADWNSNPNLIGSSQSGIYYTFSDNNVVNYNNYFYKIVPVSNSNIEFPHYVISGGQPQPIYTLYFKNQAGSIIDSIKFSKNSYATDGKDAEFDIAKSTTTTGSYIWSAFYEQYWSNNGDYLSRETFGDFDLTSDYKIYTIRFKTNQTNTPISVSISDNFDRSTEKLYFRNTINSIYYELPYMDGQITVTDANLKTFYLYWGNLNPETTITNIANCLIQGGTSKSFDFNTTFNFLNFSTTVYLKNDTDSLLVGANLLPNSNFAAFNVPDNITMHNAKLYVQTNALDNEIITTVSDYTIGIIPSNTEYTVPMGLSMLANPFPNYTMTQAELAQNLLINKFENASFSPVTSMQYNKGYFLNNPSEIEHTYSNAYQTVAETQPLFTHWNLVANPHLAPYNVRDLQFYLNGKLFSFAELVQQKVIAPVVFACRNNQYVQTLQINPYESFFIYANTDELSNLSCYFVPYNNAGLEFKSTDINWSAKILAHQNDTDEITIGCSSSKQDNIDFRFDLPEPPVKPIENALSMYIPVNPDSNLFAYNKLNSYFQSPLNNTTAEFKEWNFSMNINTLDPITFSADRTSFPANYSLRLVLNNQEHIFYSTNNQIIYTPLTTGLLSGIIRVGNQFVGNNDIVTKPLAFTAYPNPFNPQTTLALSLPKTSQVEINIYNIKGQKVKKIINEKLNAGDHNFIWNGTDQLGKRCASNIYFTMVKVNGKTHSVKKITLLK